METTAEAVALLEKEKAEGAIGFGEHYGYKLMFDDPDEVKTDIYSGNAKRLFGW